VLSPLQGYPGDIAVTRPAHREPLTASGWKQLGARTTQCSRRNVAMIGRCTTWALAPICPGVWRTPSWRACGTSGRSLTGRAVLLIAVHAGSGRSRAKCSRHIAGRRPTDRASSRASSNCRCGIGHRTRTTRPPPRVRRWLVPRSAMGRKRRPVPKIASVAALATFLGVGDGHLAWLWDARA